eukprot:TRINITY_DN115706_c0_g1_i1.p1 TRINITY_DN115706_c0_g1~~TRINITY_DN115706_c0_g1_i1.p1  ORF type:complete len:185 (+),score=0.34 TRINITY_DN115706_c0_g1_i1:44-598(+)
MGVRQQRMSWRIVEIEEVLNRPVSNNWTINEPASLLEGKLWVCGATEVPELLRTQNVDNVINCAGPEIFELFGPLYAKHELNYLEITAGDEEGYDILQHYPEVEKFVSRAIGNGGKIVVHCVAGCNRSVALVVAYMIAHEHVDWLTTITAIHSKRPQLLVNSSFKKQLARFELEHLPSAQSVPE